MTHLFLNKFGNATALSLAAVAWTAAAQSTPPTVIHQGHNPVEVHYEDGVWSFFIDGSESGRGRLKPDEAVYHLTEAARLQIPANPNFAFLGAPGDPVWIAPHIENPALLFLGISGQRIAAGVFGGDRLGLRLVGVKGPGHFAMYGLGSGGNVELFHNSRDGIGANEVALFGIGGHDHQNWAFSAPGHYELTFKAEGTLTSGHPIASPETTYRFAVGDVDPLGATDPVAVNEGDADVAVVLRDGELVLNVFWGAEEAEYRSDEAFYQVRPNSRITVPTDPAYAFLGNPGDIVWVAPQTDQPGKLFLALAADNLPTGVFTGEQVKVTLKSFAGPGTFAVYETDAFGTPRVYFNSADGISDADFRDMTPGDHHHMNWAFTNPGIYEVGFEARGTRVSDGQTLVSEVTRFTFQVVPEGPVLTISPASSDRAVVSWTGEAGKTYQLQRRDGLTEGEWAPAGPPVTGIDGPQSVEVNLGNEGTGYLRLAENP